MRRPSTISSSLRLTTPKKSVATAGSPAAGHVDLLTVVMHEMGHALGHTHDELTDVMASTLPLGTRRLAPNSTTVEDGMGEVIGTGSDSTQRETMDDAFTLEPIWLNV